MQPTPTHATYLYCVVRAARRPSVTRMPQGLPGATRPALTPVVGSLWLVTSSVPLDVFGPEQLEPRLRDLDWVSQLAVAHEAVVEHVSGLPAATVVPMKLLTMFSSPERAVDDVRRRRDAIARVMRRVEACEEWGVRIVRDSSRALAPEVGASRLGAGRGSRPSGSGARRRARLGELTGAGFLTAKRHARDSARAARQESRAAAEAAFDRLGRIARDTVSRESAPEGVTNPPILDAAFLVPNRAVARFKAEARRQAVACVAAGAKMTLSGPWPPYNFVRAAGEPS